MRKSLAAGGAAARNALWLIKERTASSRKQNNFE
jgi:hypothetical protein